MNKRGETGVCYLVRLTLYMYAAMHFPHCQVESVYWMRKTKEGMNKRGETVFVYLVHLTMYMYAAMHFLHCQVDPSLATTQTAQFLLPTLASVVHKAATIQQQHARAIH